MLLYVMLVVVVMLVVSVGDEVFRNCLGDFYMLLC